MDGRKQDMDQIEQMHCCLEHTARYEDSKSNQIQTCRKGKPFMGRSELQKVLKEFNKNEDNNEEGERYELKEMIMP
eukprot:765577-Hanusia_phi.AAC.1